MGAGFAFEGHPIYQEAMAYAYACMRRAHAFPASYTVYGDELRRRSLALCEEVAIGLSSTEAVDLSGAMTEAVACLPIIDLAVTAGLIRESERLELRKRLTTLIQRLEHQEVQTAIHVQEAAR